MTSSSKTTLSFQISRSQNPKLQKSEEFALRSFVNLALGASPIK